MSFSSIADNTPEIQNTAPTQSTISRAYKTFKADGVYYKPQWPGQPKALDEDKLNKAVEELKEGKYEDGTAISLFSHCLSMDCSPQPVLTRTLWLRMTEEGCRDKVQLCSMTHVGLSFQRDWSYFMGWSMVRVVFSNELKFVIGGSDGHCWCRRERGTDVFEKRTVSQCERQGLGKASVFVWGCMTQEGPGRLMRIEETMDRWIYINILEVSPCFSPKKTCTKGSTEQSFAHY